MMGRVPLIQAGENYILKDSSGRVQERLIEVIGEGGTYLAYKAIEEVDGTAQGVNVVLEFYPLEEEDSFSMIRYQREKAGEELQITFKSPYAETLSEEQKKKILQEELQNQEDNAQREVKSARELHYNREKQENSPYFYRTEYFTRVGDTYYLKLDTSEGRTLYQYIKEHENGRLSLRESLKLAQMDLEIVSEFEGNYLHGDIKPQNIWLRGNDAAMSKVFLDAGSCVSLKKYCCEGFKTWTEGAVIQKADEIVKNRGIGCSTKGYCNKEMSLFFDAKATYYGASELAALNPLKINLKNKYNAAVQLLDAMNHLSISSDLYAVVETMCYCATGKNYSRIQDQDLEKILQEETAVCKYFSDILKKNQKEGYASIETLQKDLCKLERMMNKDADPEVLLEAIRNTLPDIKNIDPKLFGKIK